jgi:hypothetical protein
MKFRTVDTVLAQCWRCDKLHDVSRESAAIDGTGKKCECGGYVITPSGKMQIMKIVYK